MDIVELKNWILTNLYNSNGSLNGNSIKREWWKRRNTLAIYEMINDATRFLVDQTNFSAKIYCILNDIHEQPKCPICKNPTKFVTKEKRFQLSCSHKCGFMFGNTRRKKTNIEKFGNENPAKNKDVIAKAKQTSLKKYGVTAPIQNKKIKEKMQQTCLKKYGRKNPSGLPAIILKRKKTNLKKFGTEFPAQSTVIQHKLKNNRISKFGNSYTNEHNTHLPEIARKYLNDKNWLEEQHINQNKNLTTIAMELCVNTLIVSRYFKKHGIPVKHYKSSAQEKEVVEFIKSVYSGLIIENTRSIIPPKELDIYIPDKNLAIEYNGIFWHSYDSKETNEEKNCHLNKLRSCQEKGIQLIQIFENEWLFKKEIVKSIIATKLGTYKHKIFARECDIKTIASKTAKIFLEENHLQGKCNSLHNIGLYYNDELVSLMSFSKPRFTKKYDWELTRYCCKLNTIIVGGCQRQFKHFLKLVPTNSIVSYSDKRYFTGTFYEHLGFCLIHESSPNYFYTIPEEMMLYSRNMFQKHKLSKLLENFDPELTESQNMFNNGYRRIWDCGNYVYSWNRKLNLITSTIKPI